MLRPPSPYRLRSMRLSDIKAVLAIDRLSFPTPARAGLYEYELAKNVLAHYQVLTVMGNGRSETLIGYTGYWLMADEAHVSTIAVHPDWRERGLGELLLLNLLYQACERAVTLVTLEVRASNLVAQALYQKYQFDVVGERRRYYRDTGENAILMTVLLSDNYYAHTLEAKRAALFARLTSADSRPQDCIN